MKPYSPVALVCCAVCIASSVISVIGAEAVGTLVPALEPLRPFLEKTWKGEFQNSTPEKPVVDVSKWERALNGQAVRITHSINQGAYGGETILMPNPKTKALEYHYFTTAGFQTHGTVQVEGRKLITTEKVEGSADGVTEVSATTELLEDGRMRVESKYLKNGTWVEGRKTTYSPNPGGSVVFK